MSLVSLKYRDLGLQLFQLNVILANLCAIQWHSFNFGITQQHQRIFRYHILFLRCFILPVLILVLLGGCVHAQSCAALCDPMDCSLPGSSCSWNSPGKSTGVGCHFLLQGSSPPRDRNCASCTGM